MVEKNYIFFDESSVYLNPLVNHKNDIVWLIKNQSKGEKILEQLYVLKSKQSHKVMSILNDSFYDEPVPKCLEELKVVELVIFIFFIILLS